MRNCDKCHKELEPVFPDRVRRSDDYPHYRGALVITIEGGYDMFVDNGEDKFVICSDCATELFAQNEWLVTPDIYELLEKENDGEQNS